MEAVSVYTELARHLHLPKSRLKFVDRIPNVEVPLWIRSFDIATAPFPMSEHYAYYMSPLKLFEYMAGQVPIVSTDIPAIREILRPGENAWLVPPGDPKALAKGLQYLLENPASAERLAKQAWRDVQQYTWKRRAAAILRLLEGAPA